MRTCLFIGVAVWVLSATAQDSPRGDPVTLTLAAGPHDRIVGCVRTVTSADGQTATATNTFTELATGMNRFDSDAGACPADPTSGDSRARLGHGRSGGFPDA